MIALLGPPPMNSLTKGGRFIGRNGLILLRIAEANSATPLDNSRGPFCDLKGKISRILVEN